MMRRATQAVPFSSLFYTSRPLEAALTRRLTQVLFFLFGAVHLWAVLSAKPSTLPKSHLLRFTVLEQRNSEISQCPLNHFGGICSLNNSDASNSPRISSFGLLLKGQKVGVRSKMERKENSLLLFLSDSVEWDAWYFETSADYGPEYDPVRFVLHHSNDEEEWKLVGSSSHWKFFSTVSFFHRPFATSPNRRFQETFGVFQGHWLADAMAPWLAPATYLSMSALGALQMEHLAIYPYCAQSMLRVVVAWLLVDTSQPIGGAIYFVVGLTHLGVLVLVACDRWTLSIMLVGAVLTLLGVAVRPFDYYGTRSAAWPGLGRSLIFDPCSKFDQSSK